MSSVSSGDALKAWVRALEKIAPLAKTTDLTLANIVGDLAVKLDGQPALLSETEEFTYGELARQCNRYSRWALQQLAAGEVVCLLAANCPDYIATWLGITNVRGVVALINTNLTGAALVHSINAVSPKHIIVGDEYAGAFAAVRTRLPANIQYWTHDETHRETLIDMRVKDLAGAPLAVAEQRPPSIADRALYIYTSGTTGLPKAASVSHRRVLEWSLWFAGMADVQPSDRMYHCLPMYHSVGGVVAIGAMLVNGGSVFIRPRFSASRFWDDVIAFDCTLFQYIGELCRYLVSSPPHPRETEHRLRLCCGNGLRGDVWEPFQRRFRIPRILEFYASTEGNLSLYNCEGRPGAIGRVPSFLAHRFPIALIKCDLETGEPLRNDEGFCMRCTIDEAGEAVGSISGDGSATGRPFDGYTDKTASAAKVLRDVFIKGDAWFRSGDAMRRDGSGFFYFIDRLGDTFRWKGENVSTTEVADVLRACQGITEAAVYGVEIAGAEGRAGMAALTVDALFDLGSFQHYIAERLPEYACPVFVRICDHLPSTGTFKLSKAPLAGEGFDPGGFADAVYFADRVTRTFVRLDSALYDRIQRGQARL